MSITNLFWPRIRTPMTVLTLWLSKGKAGSQEQFIYSTLVSSIMWELWKERCSRRYEEGHPTSPIHKLARKIILKVRYWCLRLAPHFKASAGSSTSTNKIANNLGFNIYNPPRKPPSLVYWTRPPDEALVLNTDGAAMNGVSAGGGILRDHQGRHMANFFNFYGEGTNNQAECRAILDGLTICKTMDITDIQIHIHTDSRMAMQWCTRQLKPPWHLKVWLRRIWTISEGLQVVYKHIYREGNKAADHIASLGLKYLSDGVANPHLDRSLKAFITGDSLNIPNIRL
ncbi:Ribonuclease h domain [Thalictrum thalictroides]|uniref:Ribonuclease h domain n=1 Tax=Thalictrum thalictroides TaxID=46969 RepID=A0A7J6W2E4_THATH|nr:Ribonuclease h domain [Thalictrum thalictroides]